MTTFWYTGNFSTVGSAYERLYCFVDRAEELIKLQVRNYRSIGTEIRGNQRKVRKPRIYLGACERGAQGLFRFSGRDGNYLVLGFYDGIGAGDDRFLSRADD